MFKAAIFYGLEATHMREKNYLLWVFDNRDSELYLQRSSTPTQ